MSEPLNQKQRRALELLREPVLVEDFRNWKPKTGRFLSKKRRQLYQTRTLDTYCITYTGDVPDSPELSRAEALGLVEHASLVSSFPDAKDVQCWECAA